MVEPLKKRLVILGATSAIAEAVARRYAEQGATLLLVARNAQRLSDMANDLAARGAERVETVVHALAGKSDYKVQLAAFAEQLGGIDHVLIAYGILGEQPAAEQDQSAAEEILQVNFNSVAGWCLASANFFVDQGSGTLLVLGSPAGDRGRRANYIYGSAKAGLATLVQGISHRFANTGPRAVIIKPGPTKTAMTRGMDQSGPLWASPDQIAAVVCRRAIGGGPIAYAPLRWWLIMAIIRNLPTRIFNRMDI